MINFLAKVNGSVSVNNEIFKCGSFIIKYDANTRMFNLRHTSLERTFTGAFSDFTFNGIAFPSDEILLDSLQQNFFDEPAGTGGDLSAYLKIVDANNNFILKTAIETGRLEQSAFKDSTTVVPSMYTFRRSAMLNNSVQQAFDFNTLYSNPNNIPGYSLFNTDNCSNVPGNISKYWPGFNIGMLFRLKPASQYDNASNSAIDILSMCANSGNGQRTTDGIIIFRKQNGSWFTFATREWTTDYIATYLKLYQSNGINVTGNSNSLLYTDALATNLSVNTDTEINITGQTGLIVIKNPITDSITVNLTATITGHKYELAFPLNSNISFNLPPGGFNIFYVKNSSMYTGGASGGNISFADIIAQNSLNGLKICFDGGSSTFYIY